MSTHGRPVALMPTPVGSVLIPAHNEAAVIERCLDALFDGVSPGELDVVVVCNGCTDQTAHLAAASRHRVMVLELEEASKPAALRAGEDVLAVFPRLYLDADVVLPGTSAVAVLKLLRSGPALAARPPIFYDTRRASSAVRSYYSARQRLPAVMGSLWGAGVYGLSAEGRSRFGAFPDVVAEDLFVDRHFSEHEIEIAPCWPAVVNAPRNTADLVRILRRTYRGNAEMAGHTPVPLRATATRSTAQDILELARTGPRPAVHALTYSALAVGGRLMNQVSRSTQWERDESSRVS